VPDCSHSSACADARPRARALADRAPPARLLSEAATERSESHKNKRRSAELFQA
jgi:hypothetical protein